MTDPRAWTFTDGRLVPAEHAEWLGDDPGGWDLALAQRGYCRLFEMGEEGDPVSVEVFGREALAGGEFLAVLAVGGGAFFVVVLPRLPRLLGFLRFVSPLVADLRALEKDAEVDDCLGRDLGLSPVEVRARALAIAAGYDTADLTRRAMKASALRRRGASTA